VGLIDRTTICSIEKSEKIENLSPNAIGWLADVGLRPSRVADDGRPDVRKCMAELMGAGPAKRECSASRLYRRETAAYLSGPSTKRTRKVPRQRIVAAGVKKQNVCLRSVLHNAMHNVESDHLELERIGGVQFGIYWDQIILACNLKLTTLDFFTTRHRRVCFRSSPGRTPARGRAPSFCSNAHHHGF
jgi:hypothetical protein